MHRSWTTCRCAPYSDKLCLRTSDFEICLQTSAFELHCFRRLLGITWKQEITNIDVKRRVTVEIGAYEPLLETAGRRRKLQWLGHVTRKTWTPAFDIMPGSVEGRRGRRQPKRTWGTDIGEWTGKSVVTYIREAKNRGRWQKIADSSKCPNGHQATGVNRVT